MQKTRILALDVATKTWWATANASGTWVLSKWTWESFGMKVIRLRAKVKEVIELEWIEVVYYERPAWFHKSSLIHEAQLIWAIIALLEDMGIQYTSFSPTEIKKHATGKGTANKEKMILEAKKKWQWVEIVDDNHADALWIYDLAETLYHS